MLAYVYPLLSVIWTIIVFFLAIAVLFYIIWCFIDNFRRKDHHGWAKAGWAILILILPLIGSIIYIVARPADPDTGF